MLVSDAGGKIIEGKTGKDGVLLLNWDKPRDPSTLSYLVVDGANAAGSGLNVPGAVVQGLTARAYLYTDRPAYRPGQKVELRGIVREVIKSQYAIDSTKPYSLTIADARGRNFLERSVKLNQFGTFHETIALDSASPIGTYRVIVKQAGGSEFSGTFEVQAYQLEKADLSFKLPQTVYRRGEKIKGSLIAVLQGGIPLSHKPIRLQLPDGRALDGTTDDKGIYEFELSTEGFGEDIPLGFSAILPGENVAANTVVMLASQGFRIEVLTSRPTYLDGESFLVRVQTNDAKGDPIGKALEVFALKREVRHGRVVEREVSRKKVETDAKTGKANVDLTIEDKDGGSYIVRVSGVDQDRAAIVADWNVSISGSKDPLKLRLITDRSGFKVGEHAKVDVHNRSGDGPALVTFEADRVLSYRLIDVREGHNALEWEVDGEQFPNFTLNVARMAENALHEARLDLGIVRDLNVKVSPSKETVGPDEQIEVSIETTDQMGKPVSAEVGLALVDRALLRVHQDSLPPIGPYFYNQTRIGAFSTSSTIGFQYHPPSVPVPDAIVEQSDMEIAERADEEKMGEARREAESFKDLGDKLSKLEDKSAPPASPPMDVSKAIDGSPAAFARNETTAVAVPFRTLGGLGPQGGGMVNGRPTSLGLATDAPLADASQRAYLARKSRAGASWGVDPNSFEKDAKAGDGVVDLAFKRREMLGNFGFELGGRGELGGEGLKPASPRQRYVETAYWNPSIVTGKDGKATIKIKAPSALSRYEFKARGATGADTLVGQASGELNVQRDFFVDLKTPNSLSEGDRPRIVARINHRGVSGKANLKLTIYAGGRETVLPRTIELKGDGVRRSHVRIVRNPRRRNESQTLARRRGRQSDRHRRSRSPRAALGHASDRFKLGSVERRRHRLRRTPRRSRLPSPRLDRFARAQRPTHDH